MCPFVEGYAGFSKTALPKHFGITGDIACSADGKTLELSDHCFSHTRYLFHRKRLKEGGQFIWVKDTEPIRFVQIGSYLGKKFDGGQPDGTGQSSGYFFHFAFDAPGHVFHRAKEPFQPRRVKIGFIDGRFFDSGGIRAQDINDGSGNLGIACHTHGNEDSMRAELQCLCYGHCGMDAELPDFVGSRTDDPPGTSSANDDRFAAQFRMVFLLNGSVKCVHVHMHKPFLQFFTHDIFMLLVNVKIEIL